MTELETILLDSLKRLEAELTGLLQKQNRQIMVLQQHVAELEETCSELYELLSVD